MFEMLGNWSFGDYFKKEAIAWAWELLTEVYHLPAERMYASVFGGDEREGLEVDDESYNYWAGIIPEERILYGSKKDNFWEMGDSGPCGPCSEIHIDLRSEEEIKKQSGRELVNADHPQVIEIWNLVFIQFNRKADGTLEPLPARHVDTGMGFERLVMAIQGKKSNYDTDVFAPLIKAITQIAGVQYGSDSKTDIAVRVVADHVRAVAFAIADGQLPSNTGAGYVIRRILRRACALRIYTHEHRQAIYLRVGPCSIKSNGRCFPRTERPVKICRKSYFREEEQSFLRTLENGIKIFEEAYRTARKNQSSSSRSSVEIAGDVAFKLYDTYGFPIDLTLLLAREKDAEVDMDAFNVCMAEQKNRSRTAAQQEQGDWLVLDGKAQPEFVGYKKLSTTSRILRYRELKGKKKSYYQIVLKETPFYAESGGQVGDTGYIESGGARTLILDTQKENDMIVHLTEHLPKEPSGQFECSVDREKRTSTENNHSATHLLHAALRQVLGTHVQQKGSLVNDKGLRFDFSHFGKVTDEELSRIEHIVNRKIREDIKLDERRDVPIEKAKKMGAMALFGEKYGDHVRVITFDPHYSVELCGGTHVESTGRIGIFKILSESSIAAGVRRIEAITAQGAEDYINSNLKILDEIKALLNSPKDLLQSIGDLIDTKAKLTKEIERYQEEKARQLKEELINSAVRKKDLTLIIQKVQLPNSDTLKKLSYDLRNQVKGLLLVLAADIEGKPQIAVMIDEGKMQQYGLNANKLIKELAVEIKGGGGGQPFFATAGGKDINGLDRVVRKATEIVDSLGF